MPRPYVIAARAEKAARVERRDALAEALGEANGAVKLASRRLTGAVLGGRRIAEIGAVIVARHGHSRMPPDLADQYAVAVMSAALWAMAGLPGSRRDREAAAVTHASETLPTATPALLAELAKTAEPMSAQDTARALEVTWAERQSLGLKLIGAADLDDEEYSARMDQARRERDAAQKRQKRRSAGVKGVAERKLDQEALREQLAALAEVHGVSVSTIRRRIAAGEVPPPKGWKSRVGTSSYIPADTTFSKSLPEPPNPHEAGSSITQFSDERDGGLQGPLSRALPDAADPGFAAIPCAAGGPSLISADQRFASTIPLLLSRTVAALKAAPSNVDRILLQAARACSASRPPILERKSA